MAEEIDRDQYLIHLGGIHNRYTQLIKDLNKIREYPIYQFRFIYNQIFLML